MSVLDDEEPVSVQSLAREVHGLRKNDSVLSNGSSLRERNKRRDETRQSKVERERASTRLEEEEEEDSRRRAWYEERRTEGEGRGRGVGREGW